jgi:hypothetical protein
MNNSSPAGEICASTIGTSFSSLKITTGQPFWQTATRVK